MAESGIFNKLVKAFEVSLDSYISKATVVTNNPDKSEAWNRKALTEVEYGQEQQYGYKERRGMVGPAVLKNMARKDSIVMSVIQTRINQVSSFSQPQKDRYSPGFKIVPREPADFEIEDKLAMADPALGDDGFKQLKFDLEKERSKKQEKQKKDIEKIQEFLLHGGMPPEESDTTYKRCDFDKFIKLITWDRLVYNYVAVELIPTKDRSRIHHFYPVSAGTIRYISQASNDRYQEMLKKDAAWRRNDPSIAPHAKTDPAAYENPEGPFRYAQVVRGRIVAAWTEKEMVFEAANPTIDPEDMGYAPGELENLIQTITSHLFAEAHNRNFFTQGIGTKGILHIKGDNISRAQLEAFKRMWLNQVVNSKNSFRPPIIGMADEVKWVPLAQTNREMEFEQWMNYLIRIVCSGYQIDPAEINFDISKINTSTLNESSNEARLKSSKDRGLRPLLDFLENIINRHILRAWDKKLADQYEFKFVGLDSETRQQEVDRLEKETRVWKTANEARIEMGYAPIDDGDIILNAIYSQYKAQVAQQKMVDEQAAQGGNQAAPDQTPPEEEPGVMDQEADALIGELDKLDQDQEKQAKKEEATQEVKKAQPELIDFFDDEN